MIKVVYHRADMDGIGSGAIFKHIVLKDKEVEYYGLDYKDDVSDFVKGLKKSDIVYMADFSLEPYDKYMMKVLNTVKKLYWIDHHTTSLEWFEKNKGQIDLNKHFILMGDNSKSAVQLCYEEFVCRQVPVGIMYLSLYDTWNWAKIDDDLIKKSILYYQLGIKNKLTTIDDVDWTQVFADNAVYFDSLYNDGEFIQSIYDKNNKYLVNNFSFDLNWEGIKFLAMNSTAKGSLQFKSKDLSNYDAVLSFAYEKDKWVISMYSERDTKIIDIAKKYGGGGHIGACGFQVDSLPFLPIKEIKK